MTQPTNQPSFGSQSLGSFWRYCALIFNSWQRPSWRLEVEIPRWRARSVTETVTYFFLLSAPHFPFIPFAQCPLMRQSNFLRLNFINSPFGDNDPLCVRLLLWSRVSSALEGDLLAPFLPPFRRADPSLSLSLKSMPPPRIAVHLREKEKY